jgi:hypothetical protein
VRALTPALLVSEKLLRDCEPALAAFVEQTAKQVRVRRGLGFG